MTLSTAISMVAMLAATVAFIATMTAISNYRHAKRAHGEELQHRLHALADYADALALQGLEYPGTLALKTMCPHYFDEEEDEQ